MNAKNIPFLAYCIIISGLIVSGYLLFHHFDLVSGQAEPTNICSTLFNKSCDAALMSDYAFFWGIPLGGWGIIYFTMLGLFILLSQWLPSTLKNVMIQTGFWVSLVGIGFSAYYIIEMIKYPELICPLCITFHVLNFIVFSLLKTLTGLSFLDLIKNLFETLKTFFLGRSFNIASPQWMWLCFILTILVGLAIFQRVMLENLNQKIIQLSNLDPLKELQTFDTLKIHPLSILPEDPILGPSDAPISLVVFSDFQCSECAAFATNFKDLVNYNTPKLNIRFKYFPLSNGCNPLATSDMHPMACQAAYAAEAAHRQGKYMAFHEALFEANLKDSKSEVFINMAQSMGMDVEKFKQDIASESVQKKIADDVAEAIKLGVNSTPTVFLNGRKVNNLRPQKLNFLIHYLSKER
jgi:protein-disulfide isomerase/uncharacterized membrane protein